MNAAEAAAGNQGQGSDDDEQQDNEPYTLLKAGWDRSDKRLDPVEDQPDHARKADDADQQPEA